MKISFPPSKCNTNMSYNLSSPEFSLNADFLSTNTSSLMSHFSPVNEESQITTHLKCQFFCNVKLHHRTLGAWHSETMLWSHLLGWRVPRRPVNIRPLHRFNTSKTKSPVTQCHIPEEVTPNPYHCKNLKIYIPVFTYTELRKTKPNQPTKHTTLWNRSLPENLTTMMLIKKLLIFIEPKDLLPWSQQQINVP